MTTDTKQIVNTSTFSSTNTLTDNTVINSIPSELLCQIFFHFSFDSNTSSSFSSSSSSSSLNFTNQRTNLKTLLSCCLVNRQWCSNAISILYSDTFSHYRFIDTNKLIETYLKCIFCYYNKYEKDEHRNNNEDEDEDEDENVNSSSSLLPSLLNLHDIITNSHHPTISRYHSSSSTLFDYPLYLKHLDYYGLIISIKKFLSLHSLYTFDQSPNSDITLYNNDLHNWTDITGLYNKHNNNNDDNDNNDYDNDNHNSIIIDGVINSNNNNNNNNNNDKSQREQQEQLKNYLIKRFLKLFYDRKSRITSLKIENTCPLNKEEEYLLWCNDDDHDNNSNSNNNENYSLLFKNLRKLFIKVNFCQDNLFSKLKDVCNNLETLKVNMSNLIASNRKTESQNLATLISSQINLKHFELHGFECSIELILPSLTSQSRSLQVLILEYLDFRDCDNNSLASILDCRKLQVLKFISCTNLNKEVFECLEEGTKNNNDRGTCGEHGDNYWNELKEVYVTPNMCEEMRSWARKIRNKINNNNSNDDNRYYNKVNPYIFLIPVYIKY